MAATFVVETGTGSSTANSYSSVAVADQYHENYGDPTAWSSLATADKERHLREATRYLDSKYGNQWVGDKYTRAQALDWPRYWAEDHDGFIVDPSTIPQALIDATVILALASVSGSLLVDESAPSGGGLIKTSKQLGPLKISEEYSGATSPQAIYTQAAAVLQKLIIGGQAVHRA